MNNTYDWIGIEIIIETCTLRLETGENLVVQSLQIDIGRNNNEIRTEQG